MSTESPFDQCSAEDVFSEVNKRLTSDELRSLWGRLQEELTRKGVVAVDTYLNSEFTQLRQDFDHALERLMPSEG